MSEPTTFTQAESPGQVALARELFLEYAGWLGFSLCFQNFDRELAELPGAYAPPRGRLILAQLGGETAGCVALRPVLSDACEMKRLYVRPAFKGRSLGRKLAEALVAEARTRGYRKMRLDTVADQMQAAVGLYRTMGFVDIPAYYDSPIPGTAYMELDLVRR